MTIGKKISLACAALVGLTIILGTVSTLNIQHLNLEVLSVVQGPLPGLQSVATLERYAKDQNVAMLEHILSDSPEQMARLDSTLADLETKFQAEMQVYRNTIQTARGRELFEKLAPVHERVQRSWSAILLLSRALKTKEALAMWTGEAIAARDERARVFAEIVEQRRSVADAKGKESIATGEAAKFWSLLILAISVLSGGLLAFFIVRGINKVLSQAVTELSKGAGQVASASSQVSSASESLAEGAAEQAASLEETSASSEEMASMTRKNAENSQHAAEFMHAVTDRVAEANRTLADMTRSMREIGESSSKISKIIKVIDEIAFQTNILALNAAVEAARAGEAGMGFAVVADEVRNLAQRSAQAARDTAALIEDSILKSAEGSAKLGDVAGSIQAITEGALKVKTLVDEVEASSKEQAQGIEQISQAVAQMDGVTQRTAANAQQSAASSEELSSQSQALMAVVAQLQALVGGGSAQGAVSGKPERQKTGVNKKETGVRGQKAEGRPRPRRERGPVPTHAGARRSSEFPLDDSEFREF